MLGFVRSACLCGVFACLASFPTDGPARLRGLLVGPPRRAPRATAPACGDGRGSVVRVASQSSQQGSSALLRKVHAAHAHCTPSAGPRCPLTLAPPKLSVLLVAAAATSAAAKSATVAAPPAPPALPAPPVPPTLPTPRARKDAIIPAAAASAGTNWPAPRERPPTPSAPAACCGMCSAVCGVDVGMGCGEVGWAWGGKEGERQPPSLIRFSAHRRSCAMASAARASAPPGRSLAEREKWPCSAVEQPTYSGPGPGPASGPGPGPASGPGSGPKVGIGVQGSGLGSGPGSWVRVGVQG
jgi:hypothetical protein